jgi:hypothetical protein
MMTNIQIFLRMYSFMPHSSLITRALGGYENFRILVCDIWYSFHELRHGDLTSELLLVFAFYKLSSI